MVFKFLKKAYAGLVTAIAKPIVKLIKPSALPITAEEFLAEPVGKALASAAAVTTIGLGIVTLPKTIPLVVKGAVTFVAKQPIAALVIGGLATVPAGRELIGQAVTGLFKGGVALGEAAEEAKERDEVLTLSEAAKAAGLVGLGLVGGALLPAGIEKVKEVVGGIDKVAPEAQFVKEEPIGVAGDVPITAPTETITTGEPLPVKEKKAPAINVKIKIDNRSKSIGIKQSHRYLNQELVC